VLFASTSGRGHLQPLIPLIRAFEDAGHQTLVIAPPGLQKTLEEGNFSFRLGQEPPRAESERIWTVFPTLARPEASRLIEREWFAGLCLNALLPAMESAFEEWSPELVIRESCEYSAAFVADRRGIRHAQVGISTAAAEASVLTELVEPELTILSPNLARRILETPYLTRFPAALDPSPFPTTLRYTERSGGSTRRLPDWWNASRLPLVYVTFGTVATGGENGVDLLRDVVATLQELDIRILVATGHSVEPGSLNDFDENVHVETWVNQDDVYAEASLVVCHGGSGTTLGALAAGVPLVLLPMFADQPTNSRLVQDAGAGISVTEGDRSASSNTNAIQQRLAATRAAVLEVLTNSTYRDSALVLAEGINGSDTPKELVSRLSATDHSVFKSTR